MFSGKLIDADFNAFCFLWKWKLGSSRMLAMGVYTHLQLGGVYSRLRHLQERKFIDTESDNKRRLVVWVLTPRGYAVVKEQLPFLREDGYRSEFLIHDYWVATVHLGEFLCSQPEGLGLFSEQQLRRYYLAEYPEWVPKSVYHRPDGYWNLPHLGGATHALEVELSRKKRSQYKSVANFYVEKKCQRVHWLVANVTTLRCVARGLRIEDPQFAERHSFYLLDHYRQCGWNSPVAYGLDKGKTLAEGLGANVAPTECRGTSVALLDTRLKRPMAERAGVSVIRFHDLRHTFASHLAKRGVPMIKIMALLGHTKMDSTLVYAHLAPSSLKGITDVLSQGASWAKGSSNEVVAFSRPNVDSSKREVCVP